MEDILFSLKKDNVIAKFISEEGEYLACKTKQYFQNLKTERPKYQGVVELVFLAMTPAQLLLFRSKEECGDIVFLTTQCENVQEKSVKLLRKIEDEEITSTTTQKKKNKSKNRCSMARVRKPLQQSQNKEVCIKKLT